MSGWWSLGLGHSRDNYICNIICNVSVPAEYYLVQQYLFMAYPAVLATVASGKLPLKAGLKVVLQRRGQELCQCSIVST